MNDKLKINSRYNQLLKINLTLWIIPSIISIIILLTKSFVGDQGEKTTLIVLIISIILIIISILLLIILNIFSKKNKSLPKILKTISITISIPVIIGMIIRTPKYIKNLLE